MSLQKQHFVVSNLKTLSVGLFRDWTYDFLYSSLMQNQLSQQVMDEKVFYQLVSCI